MLTLDVLEGLDGLVLHAVVGVPVRGLVHREDQDDAVDDRQGADQVADAPVLIEGGAGCQGDLLLGERAEDAVVSGADRGGDQACDYPASDHEGHAEGHEHAAVLRGDGLGEAGGDDRDAGAYAEAGDEAPDGEDAQRGRERLRQGEQAVEDDGDDQHLLAADAVGHSAADGAAEDHAEQAPRGQRADLGGRLQAERRGEVGVRGVDDHEVITVEDVGQAQKDEHEPGVAVDTE